MSIQIFLSYCIFVIIVTAFIGTILYYIYDNFIKKPEKPERSYSCNGLSGDWYSGEYRMIENDCEQMRKNGRTEEEIDRHRKGEFEEMNKLHKSDKETMRIINRLY